MFFRASPRHIGGSRTTRPVKRMSMSFRASPRKQSKKHENTDWPSFGLLLVGDVTGEGGVFLVGDVALFCVFLSVIYANESPFLPSKRILFDCGVPRLKLSANQGNTHSTVLLCYWLSKTNCSAVLLVKCYFKQRKIENPLSSRTKSLKSRLTSFRLIAFWLAIWSEQFFNGIRSGQLEGTRHSGFG